MRSFLIAVLIFIAGYSLGDYKGLVQGYDSAKEIYSSYYQKQINIYKDLYEIMKDECLKSGLKYEKNK